MRFGGAAAVALMASAQAVLGQAAADRVVGVYDLDTGAPLADVQIVLVGTALEWRTSAAGVAVMRNLPAGDHILRLRRIGYQPHSEFVSFSLRDTVPLTLLLKPLPVVLPQVLVDAREEQYERKLSGFLSRRRGRGTHLGLRSSLRRTCGNGERFAGVMR